MFKALGSGNQEMIEQISSIDVFFGSKVNYVLSQFVKRYLEYQKTAASK